MKKIRILLASILTLALLTSVMFISEAEQAAEAQWQADLLKLLDPADVPMTTEIQYKNTYEDGVAVSTREIACEVTVNGVAYGCEFAFEVTGEMPSDWTEVQNWLGSIVTEAASTAGSDSEALAKTIDKSISSARRSARMNGGTLPLWAQDNVSIALVRVSTPFYPELKLNKNGEDTKRLQQRLIELGFLTDRADGYFGANTKAAVEELEGYIRELEQDLIDARPAATPVPTEVPTIEPVETVEARQLGEKGKHELTLVPRETPVPTAEPTPEATAAPMSVAVDAQALEPVTRVDGVADALLQAYIYSDSFIPARRELDEGDSGSDVLRLQRRLIGMGYSASLADGHYGSDTARSIRIFQNYNNLPQTGAADMATLALLYSDLAIAPAHPMLSLQSSGNEVRALQTRLRELGFANISADGSYGASTKTAVEALQTYMRKKEETRLRSEKGLTADAQVDLSSELRIEINGIADPMLLDELYSNDFPAIPSSSLQSGSKGDDVVRLQRRLRGLEYFFGSYDGNYGAQTATAVKTFQKQHKLETTGIADWETMKVLFSGDAHKALKPYVVKVSIDDQRVYVYGLDENNEYTDLVRTMKCSTGKNETPTPKGTFQSTTGPGARWHYFKKYECWAQYAYYIEGDIMFHSVLYNDPNGPVTQSSVNNLGRKASHGCVRLSVEDAKWLYNNCPMYTKIIVY